MTTLFIRYASDTHKTRTGHDSSLSRKNVE